MIDDRRPQPIAASEWRFRWLSLLWPYRAALAAVGLCVLAQMVFYSALPMSFQVLVDDAILKHDSSVLATVLALLAATAVLAAAAGLWQGLLSARIVAGLMRDLRELMFEQLQRLSLGYYNRAQAGDLVTRFSGDLVALEEICASIVPWVVLPALSVALSTALLFVLDWRLALLAMLVWPVCLIGPRWSAPKAIAASHAKREAEAETANLVQETIAAQQIIKVFSLEDHSVAGFRRQARELATRTERLQFFSALVERLSTIGNMVLQVIVLAVGVMLTYRGDLSLGSLAAFQSLFLLLSEQLGYVMQYTPNLVRAAGSVRRISALLLEVPDTADDLHASDRVAFDRDLALDDVTFAYDGRADGVSGINLVIGKGQFVALVGPSGSGKSTVLSLIMRLYDPQRGSLRVDGHDLRDFRQAAWRSHIACVMQENFLFDISIRENIRMGRLDARNEQVEAAARAAEIDGTIRAMPAGYDTRVGQRGDQLSGGQRQRIAIARAILRDPSILLLDEATSALDAVSEATINQTLKRLAKDRTVISVTHRLAAVVDADCLFVFRDGRLVEHGRHEALLSLEKVYAGLWQKQTGFEARDDGDRVTVSVARLRAIPLLSQLTDDALSRLVPHFESGRFADNRVIVQEGDPGDKFYLIVRGKLEVYRDQGVRKRLEILSDGDFFGEIALLRDVKRTASVRTLTPSTLLSLSRNAFLEVLADVPELRETLERAVADRT